MTLLIFCVHGFALCGVTSLSRLLRVFHLLLCLLHLVCLLNLRLEASSWWKHTCVSSVYIRIPVKCSSLGLFTKCVLFARPPTQKNLDSSSLLKHFQLLFFCIFSAGAGGRQSLPSVAPPKHLPNPSNISGWTIKRLCLNGFSGLIVLSRRKSTHFWTKAATQFPSIGCHGVIFSQTHKAARGALTGLRF